MREILLIGIGGFLGSVLRYGLSGSVHHLFRSFEYPYGTLAVNVVGSFLLVLLATVADSLGMFGPNFRSFMFIGLFGAFTTFSTFSLETILLEVDGQTTAAFTNIAVNVGLCLLAGMLARGAVIWIWR